MSKLKKPLFSLDARNTLGKVVTFVKRRGQHLVESKPVPPDAQSLAQLSWRHMYLKAVSLWHALSPAEQQDWESQARRRHMTGFAWFMSQALKPNPGLYLPLQGGKMSGEIDMDGYRIEDLPDPTLPQDPDTLAARQAAITLHTAIAAAHHAKYTNAQADARIALHAAIAAAHHARYTNAQAITAAKTIKLDDFTTPDDNTDLDFSISRHGLVPKGTNVGNYLKDDGTWAAVVVAGVPSGGILIWHGTIANIPAGYVICDGNNSTPNLLTRFIQGVATAATDPGATGGAATVALSTAQLAAHTHYMWKSGAGGNPIAANFNASATPNANPSASTGSGSAHQNEPTFYDVAFIMKT